MVQKLNIKGLQIKAGKKPSLEHRKSGCLNYLIVTPQFLVDFYSRFTQNKAYKQDFQQKQKQKKHSCSEKVESSQKLIFTLPKYN